MFKSFGAKTENNAPTAVESVVKKCSHCKEEILKDAKVCKHCSKKQPIVITKKGLLVAGFVVLALYIMGSLGSSSNDSIPVPAPATQSSTLGASQAQAEFDSVMSLSKKAGLVTSYSFSETENVVYVGNVWYTQTVQFKKDFLAKISMLRESISGRHRFEVRDAYSNEKVAEVTAFSGSLEVYK